MWLIIDSLIIETQAPLAIQTRKKSVAAIEEFNEFGPTGVSQHPAAAAREEAVLLPEIRHQVAASYPMKGDGTVLPCIIEKMIENVFGEFSFAADL